MSPRAPSLNCNIVWLSVYNTPAEYAPDSSPCPDSSPYLCRKSKTFKDASGSDRRWTDRRWTCASNDAQTLDQGERSGCKTHRFKGIALLTVFASRHLVSLSLVVTEMRQSGSRVLHGFNFIIQSISNSDIRKRGRECHPPLERAHCNTTWKFSLPARQIEPVDLQRGKH